MERHEKHGCNMPAIFAEMLKDEVNATDEQKLYNGIRRMLKRYSEDRQALSIIDEFTRVISGGASLDQIMQISIDEAQTDVHVVSANSNNGCPNEDNK